MGSPGERRTLRVLSINSHQPYIHMLKGLPHHFFFIDKGLRGFPCRWDHMARPLSERFNTLSL